MPAPLGDLFPEAYAELRRIAAAHMRRERDDHTLQATALTNEVYLKLARAGKTPWKGKAHFLAIAARSMRQILVQHARGKNAVKRGRDAQRVSLEEAVDALGTAELGLLDVHEALLELEQVGPRQAQIVEMRFFAGMKLSEIAEVLDLGYTTVQDDWYLARAWLRDRLEDGE